MDIPEGLDISWTKEVYITIDGHRIELGQNKSVVVDGLLIPNLPAAPFAGLDITNRGVNVVSLLVGNAEGM